MNRLRQMMRTTAFRLTLVYSILFGALAIGVVFYIGYNTGRLLIAQFQETINEEVQEIARLSSRRGIRTLIPLVERRSRQPGANLYLVADARGRFIAGNVKSLDRGLLAKDGWRTPPFVYERFGQTSSKAHRAVAKVFTLPGNLKLLIGRDIGDADRFRKLVFTASTVSLGVMVFTGVFLWFFMGRRALKHIDLVSRSSERIIAGDLSERLPLSGVGDEFDRLSANLNRLLERVETLNTGMRVMSDSIAHDLRTPLTRLRNHADVALMKSKGGDPSSSIEEMIEDTDGLIRTFDALLMISQVESGVRTAQLTLVDLAQISSDVFELFEPSAEDASIDLQLAAKETIFVLGNRELIAQAITNLLDNALKYGTLADLTSVTLALKKKGNYASIMVADNGSGIPPDQREKVLKRFARLDESRTLPGSGLGLSLVEAIAKLHGGNLILEDNYPGLKTTLMLPIDG